MRRPGWQVPLALLVLAVVPPRAEAWDRGRAVTFGTLPAGVESHPEGITVDRAGNVYVPTFAVSKPAGPPGVPEVFVNSITRGRRPHHPRGGGAGDRAVAAGPQPNPTA